MSSVYGIIPAAGRSRRMGRPKPALPIRGRPMLHQVAEALLDAPLDAVVIVVSEVVLPVTAALEPRCEIVLNPRPDAEMIESIQLAIRHIDVTRAAHDTDGVLVCPCDAAGISVETVRACATSFRRDPSRLVIATYGGKRGHPIILPRRFTNEILALASNEGLNQIPRRHAANVLEVPCDDPGVVRNVNTPADYDGLAE